MHLTSLPYCGPLQGGAPSQASPHGRVGGDTHHVQARSEGQGCIETKSENHENGGNQGLGAKDQDGVGEEEGWPTY